MDLTKINTPPWQDKALWLSALVPLLTMVNAKLGIQVDAVTEAGIILPVLAYVVAHKWKTTVLHKALIAADAGPVQLAPVAAPASAPKPAGFIDVRASALFALFSGSGAVLAMLVCSLVLTGCATLKLWWAAEVDCAKQDSAQILSVVPDLVTKLADQDWVAAALDGGNIVGELQACALETVRQAGLNNHPAVSPQVAANAQALSSNVGKVVKNAPKLPGGGS